MYRVVSAYIEIEKENKKEAIQTATLNAAAVFDENDTLIADYRTFETENDERG